MSSVQNHLNCNTSVLGQTEPRGADPFVDICCTTQGCRPLDFQEEDDTVWTQLLDRILKVHSLTLSIRLQINRSPAR